MDRIKKAANIFEKTMNIVFTFCGFLAAFFVILITGFLLTSGMPAIGKIGICDFLFGTEWASTASTPSYGILPFILTSVYGTLGAIIIGVPLGLMCAILNILMYLSAGIICLILLGLIGYILYRGLPHISLEFLTSKPSLIRETVGILPNVLNTVYIILITLVIVLPIGVGAAIYLNEYAENDITHDENTYNLIANPVYENDKIIGAVIAIIDITESVKREQLRQEFTSNVSHELKTPLTSISGFAEMMKSGGTPDATVVDFSTSIYDEAQRLITLVSDIMKISELDEGVAPLEKEQVDLCELSKDVVKRLTPVASKRNITLSVIGDTANVHGAKKILDEMIYNLCDNAIKYNKENGTVDVIINTTDSKVNLTVRDTGIGIPQSEQSRVFERFYRVDKSHSKLVGGTGLGLAIVKHGAAYHDAEISLESAEGKGTSVTISFRK